MAFMLPTGLLYLLVKDLLAGSTSGRTAFYLLGCAACFALILLTTWFQYNGTYFTTYKESGTRRLTLAERLRKLPLSFFGKRDLADLTSTIMADCEVLEKDCSHFIPGLFGSLISTVLIACLLYTWDETAVHLIDQIDYDFSEAEKNSRSLMQCFGALEVAMRQNDLAFEVRAYLKMHPCAAVVNLGCGLDNTGRACDNGRSCCCKAMTSGKSRL